MSEEERELWIALRGSETGRAREQLFSRYLPVARRIAWRFKHDDPVSPVDVPELMQLASVGLLEAIEKFNANLGVPFRFYCTRRIAGAILDGIALHSEINQQIATRRRIERERLRSIKDSGSNPTTLDEKLGLIGDIAAELAIGLMLEDTLSIGTDDRDPSRDAYQTLAWKQAVDQLLRTLDGLPQRERDIIRYHYLECLPFAEIAKLLGLSKGRISQIHKRAIGLLRKRLCDMGTFRLEG